MWKSENKNDVKDKQEKSFVVLVSCIALIISSVVLIFVQLQKQPLSNLQIFNSHQAKIAEFEFEMSKQAAMAELRKNAPAGYKYDDLVKNEFGFWEDENGFVYEVELYEGINVISPLGKLSKEKQRALQKERKEKEKQIVFHKQELEKLGVEIDKKKKTGSSGIPTFDAGTVNLEYIQKTINEAKKMNEKGNSENTK